MTSTIALILLLVTFTNLVGAGGSQLDAAIAGTVLSSIFIILLDVVSFFTLMRSLAWSAATRRPAGSKFAFPFVAASFLHLAFFLLLTGLTLTSNRHLMQDLEALGQWTSADTTAYTGAYVMAYITCGTYFLMFIVLALLHRSLFRVDAVAVLDSSTGLTAALRAAEGGGGSRGAMSHELVARPDSALPSDYADSIAAARRNAGAWKA